MRVCGTGCVGRVDRSSKIFNPPSPVLKAGASCVLLLCVYMLETRCVFVLDRGLDTEAEVGIYMCLPVKSTQSTV